MKTVLDLILELLKNMTDDEIVEITNYESKTDDDNVNKA